MVLMVMMAVMLMVVGDGGIHGDVDGCDTVIVVFVIVEVL